MGIMMTFSALFYLIYNEYVQNMIHLNFYYLFPVFSAFFWGLHNVLTKQYQIKRYDFMIFVYFFGGCLALILHLQFETFQSPGIKDVMFLFLLGTTSHFFAYLMWIEGIKRGDAKKLLSLGYFNPVLSVFLLAMFGYTPLTSLVIICSLIMATGCYLANQKH